jgi:diadenosine tetraphosphatase ApaH/serine/threonine PP2A family protein phosphatase
MTSRPELKEEDDAGFCRFFRNLPQKNEDTVRIFDRGDYYSAHGEDARFIAATVSEDDVFTRVPYVTNWYVGLQDDGCNPQARP